MGPVQRSPVLSAAQVEGRRSEDFLLLVGKRQMGGKRIVRFWGEGKRTIVKLRVVVMRPV